MRVHRHAHTAWSDSYVDLNNYQHAAQWGQDWNASDADTSGSSDGELYGLQKGKGKGKGESFNDVPEEENRDSDTTPDCLGSKQFNLEDDWIIAHFTTTRSMNDFQVARVGKALEDQ